MQLGVCTKYVQLVCLTLPSQASLFYFFILPSSRCQPALSSSPLYATYLLDKLIIITKLPTLLCFSTSHSHLDVATDCGEVSGYIESGVNIYLGIPYATPALGPLRWQNSMSLKDGNGFVLSSHSSILLLFNPLFYYLIHLFLFRCWQGTLNTTDFGSICAQPGVSIEEDCLFLNVWTPSLSPKKQLPVMFCILFLFILISPSLPFFLEFDQFSYSWWRLQFWKWRDGRCSSNILSFYLFFYFCSFV